MAQVLVSEAAKMVNKSRKSLYRHIKEGKLSVSQSVSGEKTVETSELIRVYGALRQVETVQAQKNVTARDTDRDSMAGLVSELRLLREEVASLRGELASVKALPAPQEPQEPDRKKTGGRLLNALGAVIGGMGAAVEALK